MKEGKWIDFLQQVVRQKYPQKQKSALNFYVYNTTTNLKMVSQHKLLIVEVRMSFEF